MGTIDRMFGQRETSEEKRRGRAFERGRSWAIGKFAALLGALAFVLLLTSITSPPAGAANLSWATRASMPTVRSGLGVAAANNGKVYAIGGTTTSGVFDASVEEYDPANDTWATRASIPTARSSFGVAAAGNGKIYAIGGNFPPLSTVEEYDPGTDTWATRASMPTARFVLAAAAASNGKVYAVGGINGLTSPPPTTGLLEEYDPGTDTWATKTSMPTARYCLALAAASNGKLYAVGGVVPVGVFSATVEEYDPGTDTWATKASMPTARACPALVAASNGKLYAIGGLLNNAGEELNTVDEYDPATDTWTAQTSMAFARHLLGAAAAGNGKLYAIGGQNGSAYLATNEEATTAPIGITVDIKPGSFPNSINPRGKGVIPVAILTTDTFDATTVDPLSLAFGPNAAVETHGQGHVEDADGDGDLDLVLHFRTQDTGIQCGDTSASLTGETFGGQMIEGSDSINTVGCK